MKVLYAASEAVPFCKTGGLADVAGSLPKALAAMGVETAAVLPLYQTVRENFSKDLEFVCYDFVDLAWRNLYCGLFKLELDGVTWYFIDNEQYFNRPGLYGHFDDGERFGFYAHAVVKMLRHMDFKPDVINCNDWQTALIPVYLRTDGQYDEWYHSIRTLLSIHNIQYQGQYAPETMHDLFGLADTVVDDGTMIMDGCVNLLKAGIVCANAVNAVSPTYAEELKFAYFAHGMESIINQNSFKLHGVLNGIDTVRYNPKTDPKLAVNYDADSIEKRAANKEHLQTILGLQQGSAPIIGIVSRLVNHKGFDLVCEAFHDIMSLGVQVAILGQGDWGYENFFSWAAEQYAGRVGVKLGYSDELATAIYGGSDLFLMPSQSEPCGLSQMIAMRYGSVPIVRETGGLKDSVEPYEAWRDSGDGFSFAAYNSSDMLFVIREAVDLFNTKPEAFARLQKRAMAKDLSWANSAAEYKKIYESITLAD